MRIFKTSDQDLRITIENALEENDHYCPCNVEKNEDTKCMCKEFRMMQSGTCHCGLFIKEA